MDFDDSDAAVIVTINNMEDDRQALQDELTDEDLCEAEFEDVLFAVECEDCGSIWDLEDTLLSDPTDECDGYCPDDDCGGRCFELD